MARGNNIVVQPYPHGQLVEGIIGAGLTPKPGTIMQMDVSVPLQGGRFTWVLYSRSADGDRPAGPLIVLDYDKLQGRIATTAYNAGERAIGYIPNEGDELNCLVADIAGTGDTHTKGEVMIPKTGTGKLIATTGTPQTGPFLLLETITAPVADTLAWVRYTGY